MKVKSCVVLAAILCPRLGLAQEVVNTSPGPQARERILRIETTLPVPQEAVWEAFATVEGLRKWAAPVIELDLRTGGTMLAHYDPDASIGSPGTIRTTILNYLEGELITYKANLTDRFPAKARAEDTYLQEIVRIVPLSAGSTRIVSTMVGWGTGPEWDETYEFFARGNEYTYRQLANALTQPQE